MVVNIHEEVRTIIPDGFFNDMVRMQGLRERGLHVSEFEYDCPRKIFYSLNAPPETPEESSARFKTDLIGLYKVHIGSKLHEVPLTDDHEHEFRIDNFMEVNGEKISLLGHADEIFTDSEGGKWIIDKKFVGWAPLDQMQAHHRNQVGIYSALYRKLEKVDVKGVILIYFKPLLVYTTSTKNRPPEWVFEPDIRHIEEFTKEDIDAFEEMFDGLISDVKTALETKSLPRKTGEEFGWYCDKYCPFKIPCFGEELDGSGNNTDV